MNKHQIKGSATETVGKVQRKTGTLTSSRKLEIKGGTRELAGKAERTYGDMKEKAAKSRDQGNA